jgi:hypothetical protein
MNLQCSIACCRLQVARHSIRIWICRIDEKRDGCRPTQIFAEISRSGKSGVTRSRNNQQNKERGNDDRGDEPALSTLLSGSRKILAFAVVGEIWPWGIGHSLYVGTIA